MLTMATYLYCIVLVLLKSCHSKASENISTQDGFNITNLVNSYVSNCTYKFIPEKDYPAAKPNITSETCRCMKEQQQCNYTIHWMPSMHPMHPVTAYRFTFYPDGYPDTHAPTKQCYRLPPHQRVFNFVRNFRTIFKKQLIEMIPFVVIAEPINDQSKSVMKYSSCPKKLQIHPALPNNIEISVGGHFIFNCTFTGYPLPDATNITWTFLPFNLAAKKGIILHNNKHLTIIKELRTTRLKITDAQRIHEGRYMCHVRNYFGDYFSDTKEGSLWVHENAVHKKDKVGLLLGLLLGGTGGAILLFVLLFIVVCNLRKKRLK